MKIRFTLIAVLIAVWFAIEVSTADVFASDTVAVIAHLSVPDQELNKTRLLDIYTGDVKNWSDGKPVVVIDLKPASDVKETFYKYIGKSPSRMKSVWMKRMLSGEGDPPVAVESENEMIKRVAATPGAIGFVSRDAVNDTVKTLAIIDVKSDDKK